MLALAHDNAGVGWVGGGGRGESQIKIWGGWKEPIRGLEKRVNWTWIPTFPWASSSHMPGSLPNGQVRMKSYEPWRYCFVGLAWHSLHPWEVTYQFYQLLHFFSAIVALKVPQKPPALDLLKPNTPTRHDDRHILFIWESPLLPWLAFLCHEVSCDQFLYPTPLQVPKRGRLSEYQSLMLISDT